MKIHSSCEIEDFVEAHLCKLCVILRSRVLRDYCRNSKRALVRVEGFGGRTIVVHVAP